MKDKNSASPNPDTASIPSGRTSHGTGGGRADSTGRAGHGAVPCLANPSPPAWAPVRAPTRLDRRASSAIEGFNAVLRPRLHVRKGSTQGFLGLLRFRHILRVRRWARHQGTSVHQCVFGRKVEDWLTFFGRRWRVRRGPGGRRLHDGGDAGGERPPPVVADAVAGQTVDRGTIRPFAGMTVSEHDDGYRCAPS